jgi:hypothetical protein
VPEAFNELDRLMAIDVFVQKCVSRAHHRINSKCNKRNKKKSNQSNDVALPRIWPRLMRLQSGKKSFRLVVGACEGQHDYDQIELYSAAVAVPLG